MAAKRRPLIDLVIEDPRWDAAGIGPLAEAAARAAAVASGLAPDTCEVSLLATGDEKVAELNAMFRGIARPTNVLSWPAFSGESPEEVAAAIAAESTVPVFLGDVAVAWETCTAEADAAGKPFAHHVGHLIVHGVLHLLGHDHRDDDEAVRMERLESKALASLGVPDPY